MTEKSHKHEKGCRQCGKCCLAGFIAYADAEDLERWERERRQDILAMIENEHAVWMGDHLISADDGHCLHGCPFLTWDGDHTLCGIYDTRPRICRDYLPGSSEICPQYTEVRKQ